MVRVVRNGNSDRLITHGDPSFCLPSRTDADAIYTRVKGEYDVLDDRRAKPQKVGR